MPFGLLGRHIDALSESDPSIQKLLSGTFQPSKLGEFQSSYVGQPFDIFAFGPIIDKTVSSFRKFYEKYQLSERNPTGFLMDSQDAEDATHMYKFMTFLLKNCVNVCVAPEIMFHISIWPHLFALAVNPSVAIAACHFGISYPESDPKAEEHAPLAKHVTPILTRNVYIPFSSVDCTYMNYLTEIPTESSIETSLKIGDLQFGPEELNNSSTMELIRKGMDMLPREFWSELIYECRKLESLRPDNLKSRLEIVEMNIAYDLLHLKLVPSAQNWSMHRYTNVLDPQLLSKFPQLADSATVSINRDFSWDMYDINKTIMAQYVQSNEVILYALQTSNAELMTAIYHFYKEYHNRLIASESMMVQPVVLSPSATVLVLSHLEASFHDHTATSKRPLIAMLKLIKLSMESRVYDFMGDNPASLCVFRFVSMLDAQIQDTSFESLEASRLLLEIIFALLKKFSEAIVDIAVDNLTMPTLAAAIKHPKLQASAVSCLVRMLNSEMVCYNVAEDLWPQIVQVSDPIALLKLFSYLHFSERGEDVIAEYKLEDKVLSSALSYACGYYCYSTRFYDLLKEIVFARGAALIEKLASQIPKYLDDLLACIEKNGSEFDFDIQGCLSRRFSKNEKIVDHCIWLLTTLAPFGPVKNVLIERDTIDKIFGLLTHKYLPYSYFMVQGQNMNLRELWVTLSQGDMLYELLEMFLKKLELAFGCCSLREITVLVSSLKCFNFQADDELAEKCFKFFCTSATMRNVCAQLESTLVKLLISEGESLGGEHEEIVRCFRTSNSPKLDRDNFPERRVSNQLKELVSWSKLQTPREQYDTVKAEVNLARSAAATLISFKELLYYFLNNLSTENVYDTAGLTSYVGACTVSALKSFLLKKVEARFAFNFYMTTIDDVSLLPILEAGGLEALMEKWAELQSVEFDDKYLQPNDLVRSNYFVECKDAIETVIKQFQNHRCDREKVPIFESNASRQGRVLISNFKGVGKLFECMRGDDTPMLSQLSELPIDKTHDLSSCLWLQEYIIANYDSILEKQDIESLLHCTKLMAKILICLDRLNPSLSTLLPKLVTNSGTDLALLGALIEQGIEVYEDLTKVSSALHSSNPIVVSCAARVLLAKPQSIPTDIDFADLLIKNKEPLTVLMLLELLNVSTLSKKFTPTRDQVHALLDHCINVFEQNDFNVTCSFASVSLIDLLNSFVEKDSSIHEQAIIAILARSLELETLETGRVDKAVSTDLSRLDAESVQHAVERYLLIDTPTQELFNRRYLSSCKLTTEIVTPALCEDVGAIVDILMEKYIAGADRLLNCGTEYFRCIEEAEHLENRSKTAILASSLIPKREKIYRARVALWAKYRQSYLKLRIFVDTLTYCTYRYSSAIDYLVSSSLFSRFVTASLKCAALDAVRIPKGTLAPTFPSFETKLQYVFFPLVNVLKSSQQFAREAVLRAAEVAIEKGGREMVCGLLQLLEVQSGETGVFLKDLQNSRIPDLVEKHLDFSSRENQLYDLECAFYRFVNRVASQHQEFKLFISAHDVKVKGYEDPSLEYESDDCGEKDLYEDDDIIGEESGEDSLTEDELASDNNSEFSSDGGSENNDDDDYDDYDYDEEDEEEGEDDAIPPNSYDPYEIVTSVYDTRTYATFSPYRFWASDMWPFNARYEEFEARTMLEAEQIQSSPVRHTPIYLWTHNSPELFNRGLDFGMLYLQNNPNFDPVLFVNPDDWPYFVKEGVTFNPSQAEIFVRNSLRKWDYFAPTENLSIDWSRVERVDRSQLSIDEADPPSNADSDWPQENENGEELDAKHSLAVEKAVELLDDPELASTLGLDIASLDELPKEMQLEAVISWLIANSGEDMSKADILATFDEELFIAACEDAENNTIPQYLQDAVKSPFICEKSIMEATDRKYLESITLCTPKWSTGCHLQFSYFCNDHYTLYPTGFANKQQDTELLDFFLENFSDFSSLAISTILIHLDDAPWVTSNALRVLEVIDSPLIASVGGTLAQALSIATKFLATGKKGILLKEGILIKIVNLFFKSTLFTSSREGLAEVFTALIRRGYISRKQLSKFIFQRTSEQLSKCELEGNSIDEIELSKLEQLLSIISTYSIGNLKLSSDDFVDQFTSYVNRVSQYALVSKFSSASLLKCFLHLVEIAPSTRLAFIEFARENHALLNQMLSSDKPLLKRCSKILKGNYDILSYQVKVELVRLFSAQTTKNKIFINVRRDHVVQDTFTELLNHDEYTDLCINFIDEMGTDGGGLIREWLVLLARNLADSDLGLFERRRTENHYVVHPNVHSLQHDEANLQLFEIVGRLMAIAIFKNIQFDCKFSSIVFKTLVTKGDVKLEMEDVEEFDPELAKSLRWILENEITDVIMDTFTTNTTAFGETRTVELIPGGSSIKVTEKNKQEYVDLRIQNIYQDVAQQVEAIRSGFYQVLPLKITKVLDPNELEKLIRGSTEIDVEEWKQCTTYHWYTPESALIQNFWKLMASVSNDTRRKVLMFATGSDSVSSLGFSLGSSGTRFVISPQGDGQLPKASTCSSKLSIPNYSSYEELRVKLLDAIEMAYEGFGLV